MKIKDLIAYGTKRLEESSIESAKIDAKLLLCKFLNKDKIFLITNKYDVIEDYSGYDALLARREKHEPMQYIIGKAEFMGLEFEVNKNVLIPRPDTETLAEKAIEFVGDKKAKIIDIGTGSGCLAVSILRFCENAEAYSVDISADAIGVARKNAERNGVLNRLKFINADVFSDFPSFKVDGIVSNPPYIEDGDFTSLMTDVRDYEPKIALLGGKDGLDFYRLICKRGFKILNEGGFIAFEVGYNQAKEVKQILVENQFENIGFSMDLAGINRVVYAFKNK